MKKHNLSGKKLLKFFGIGIGGIVVLAIVVRLLIFSFEPLFGGGQDNGMYSVMSAPKAEMAYDMAYEMDFDEGSRISMPPAPTMPSSGETAEDFEITEYNTSIETRDLSKTCGVFTDLKARDYVIFENANEYDNGCSFSFKVKKSYVADVLAIIEGLDPKDFSENSYTIKRSIDEYSDEQDILVKKLSSIETTLENALMAYEEITKIATDANDVESLAKLIDAKLQTIERLSNEKIQIAEQIDRLEKYKMNQLDRLDYTYFYVSVYELKYFDLEDIKDSWNSALKDLFYDANEFLQNISVYLVVMVFYILQGLLYLFILLFVAKYTWRLVKYIWKK